MRGLEHDVGFNFVWRGILAELVTMRELRSRILLRAWCLHVVSVREEAIHATADICGRRVGRFGCRTCDCRTTDAEDRRHGERRRYPVRFAHTH